MQNKKIEEALSVILRMDQPGEDTMSLNDTGEVKLSVWTIGHSTRTIDEFLLLLTSNSIEVVADIRRFPGSRKYPHFNQGNLSRSLADTGVEYVEFPELGGRRRPRPDSPNIVWRNESFRGYADHMATEEFHHGVERLLTLAAARRTAIMCSEAVWWRCHRALVADHLKSTGVTVYHILSVTKTEEHRYTSAARIADGKLTYRAN